MEVINRSAIIIKPKKKYLVWANKVAQSMENLDNLRRQSKIILIPESAYNDNAGEIIKENFKQIFEIELDGWATDRKYWPEIQDYETFLQWFEIEVIALVLDSFEQALTKEPYK